MQSNRIAILKSRSIVLRGNETEVMFESSLRVKPSEPFNGTYGFDDDHWVVLRF